MKERDVLCPPGAPVHGEYLPDHLHLLESKYLLDLLREGLGAEGYSAEGYRESTYWTLYVRARCAEFYNLEKLWVHKKLKQEIRRNRMAIYS